MTDRQLCPFSSHINCWLAEKWQLMNIFEHAPFAWKTPLLFRVGYDYEIKFFHNEIILFRHERILFHSSNQDLSMQ